MTAEAGHPPLGALVPVWAVLPFFALIVSIAILPLVVPHWWERERNRALLTAAIALPFAGWWVGQFGAEGARELDHTLLDYISFITLIGSLYVITGGVHVGGSLAGTPLSNTVMLAVGAVIANLIGTTGASTLLIRPLLRANEARRRKAHLVIFFIFIVSNCGGLLTPLGDPPLFLGFLRGVPFAWTFQLWKPWLFVVVVLLLAFNVIDQFVLNREEESGRRALLDRTLKHEPVRLDGLHNLMAAGGLVLVVVGSGYGWLNDGEPWSFGWKEALMLALALVSYRLTAPKLRRANRFSFAPIVEVAVLFFGIFVTMTAPLLMLNYRAAQLPLSEPWQFFWTTGALSSFLDNAPTYITFAAVAAGRLGVSAEEGHFLGEFLELGGSAVELLAAVSCGAVFMGANTYIGNGPNFMVKAIAEHHGVRMPSFVGYIAWSSLVLLPIFALTTLIFFI